MTDEDGESVRDADELSVTVGLTVGDLSAVVVTDNDVVADGQRLPDGEGVIDREEDGDRVSDGDGVDERHCVTVADPV